MPKTTVLVIAVILIFIVGVVYALFRLGEANTQEVMNRFYGSEFSFTYPLGYELQEERGDIYSIGSTTQHGFVSAVTLNVLPLATDSEDIHATIRELVLSLCAAEASSDHVSCTAVSSEEAIETVSGENGTMYWLTLTREVPGQAPETRNYGPLYAYIVSTDESGGTPVFSLLVAHTPVTAFLAGVADTALLTRINDSIGIGGKPR